MSYKCKAGPRCREVTGNGDGICGSKKNKKGKKTEISKYFDFNKKEPIKTKEEFEAKHPEFNKFLNEKHPTVLSEAFSTVREKIEHDELSEEEMDNLEPEVESEYDERTEKLIKEVTKNIQDYNIYDRYIYEHCHEKWFPCHEVLRSSQIFSDVVYSKIMKVKLANKYDEQKFRESCDIQLSDLNERLIKNIKEAKESGTLDKDKTLSDGSVGTIRESLEYEYSLELANMNFGYVGSYGLNIDDFDMNKTLHLKTNHVSPTGELIYYIDPDEIHKKAA